MTVVYQCPICKGSPKRQARKINERTNKPEGDPVEVWCAACKGTGEIVNIARVMEVQKTFKERS